jgi:hypothetical protein
LFLLIPEKIDHPWRVMMPTTRRAAFQLKPSLWLTYVVIYFVVGTFMNNVGQWLAIARFTYWWQVITVYVLYMVPISVAFRGLPWWRQYLYGLLPMGLLELGGYALHSSYAYPHNLIDRFLDPRNFALVMALFFAAYFPLLNALVAFVHRAIVPRGAAPGKLQEQYNRRPAPPGSAIPSKLLRGDSRSQDGTKLAAFLPTCRLTVSLQRVHWPSRTSGT